MGHFLQRQHLPVTASTFGGAIMGFVPRCSWGKGAERGGCCVGVLGFIGRVALGDEFAFTDSCRLC